MPANLSPKQIAEVPPWLNGKPYYCALCGLGFGEFIACEEPDCVLETEAEAQARATRAELEAHHEG